MFSVLLFLATPKMITYARNPYLRASYTWKWNTHCSIFHILKAQAFCLCLYIAYLVLVLVVWCFSRLLSFHLHVFAYDEIKNISMVWGDGGGGRITNVRRVLSSRKWHTSKFYIAHLFYWYRKLTTKIIVRNCSSSRGAPYTHTRPWCLAQKISGERAWWTFVAKEIAWEICRIRDHYSLQTSSQIRLWKKCDCKDSWEGEGMSKRNKNGKFRPTSHISFVSIYKFLAHNFGACQLSDRTSHHAQTW